jgi:hypothetical protein
LKLVNGFLRDRVLKYRQPLSLALLGANAWLGLVAFDARKRANAPKAVARTIGVSLELLDNGQRARALVNSASFQRMPIFRSASWHGCGPKPAVSMSWKQRPC